MNKMKRLANQIPALAVTLLLTLAFALCEPGEAMAQTVTGTGTTGKIPKFTGSSAIGDSVITELNGSIGIGTNNPASILHVVSPGVGIFSRDVTGFSIDSQQSAIQIGLNGGTMLAGGGPSFLFFADNNSTTPTKQFLGRLSARWENPFAGSEAAGIAFSVRANSADWSASTEAMRITSAGNVGIGTTSPSEKLQIGAGANVNVSLGTATNNKGFLGTFNDVVTFGINRRLTDGAWTDPNKTHAEIEVFSGNADSKILFLTASANNTIATERVRIDKNGNVGIGTTTPSGLLHLASVAGGYSPELRISNSTFSGDPNIKLYHGSTNEGYRIRLAGGSSNLLVFDTTTNDSSFTTRVTFDANGNVGIGTTTPSTKLHVVGDITVTGNIAAKYQDIAEWVPSRQAMPAATVVVLDPDKSNHVLASSTAYDTRVAGVVSEKPGVVLGEGGEGKLLVATTGRVRVKVDATRGPIRVGDLLVTSEKEGIAMKSEPIEVGGAKIHRPGTIIGKALEPLEKGVGEILVLLSLQ